MDYNVPMMNRLPRPLLHGLVVLLPIAAAALLALEGNRLRSLQPPDSEEVLLPVRVSSVAEAERLFASLDYGWPPREGATVPRIAVDPLPPDLSPELSTTRKKLLFFRLLLPMVLAENRELRAQRRHLLRLRGLGTQWQEDPVARAWLDGLLARYRVSTAGGLAQALDELLLRLDEVPPALVLAQAANESAWGTSRFARRAKNLFGQWTWQAEHGLVPAARPEGETYLVRKFPTLRDSVSAYLYNINVGHAYGDLRRLRGEMRGQGRPLDALVLAAGLHRYSERGADYVAEIRRIIRKNRLERLSAVDLMPREAMRLAALRAGLSGRAAGSTGG